MTDLLRATQDAVFAALNVDGVTGSAAGVTVWTSVPPGMTPPFVEIGSIDAEEFQPVKMPGIELHTIEVAYRWRGDTRLPLLAMMDAGRIAFEATPLTAPGARFDRQLWRASATDREDDGVTWHGAQRFDVLVQQA